jgi:serine/threonine-protein kinase
VYLSDFGIAKAAVASVSLTEPGLRLGTPDYSAPEQLTGQAVDGRADQYALACVTVALLTGRPPYTRTEQMALLWAHMSDPAPSIAALRPELPPAVDAVIARGMAKSPDDRYPSCGAFAAALRQSLGTPTSPLGTMGDPGTHPATVLSPPRGTTAAPPSRGFQPTERAPAPAAFTTPPAGPGASWPPAAGSAFAGGAFTEPADTARMPGAGGTGAGGHPAWDRAAPEPRNAGGAPAPYPAAPAPFRGTPPSAQSAIRRAPAERTGLAGWLSDIPIRPILIGVGVIIVLIIIALTTH